MVMPFAIRQDIERILVLDVLDGSGFGAMVEYAAFKHIKEIDWCAGDSIACFPCVWDTALVRDIPVFHWKWNKRETSAAWRLVVEHAAVKVSLRDQEKTAVLTEGRKHLKFVRPRS